MDKSMEEKSEMTLAHFKIAESHFDRFISAYNLARQQESVIERLKYDEIAFDIALQVHDERIKACLHLLCLNIAKGYEDTDNLIAAKEYYRMADIASNYLNDGGFGSKILSEIKAEIELHIEDH